MHVCLPVPLCLAKNLCQKPTVHRYPPLSVGQVSVMVSVMSISCRM